MKKVLLSISLLLALNTSYSQSRKAAGNSVSVPVIKAIAGEIIRSLKEEKPISSKLEEFILQSN